MTESLERRISTHERLLRKDYEVLSVMTRKEWEAVHDDLSSDLESGVYFAICAEPADKVLRGHEWQIKNGRDKMVIYAEKDKKHKDYDPTKGIVITELYHVHTKQETAASLNHL